MRQVRVGLSCLFALYGVAILAAPDSWSFIDNINLPIHETGHLVFAPFGEPLDILGGTLLQLLLPMAFAWHFTVQRDEHAASLGVWWVGQNCINIARYIADAQIMELPLVGGGEHDWNIMLSDWGVLHNAPQYANLVRGFGVLVMLVATVWGLFAAMDQRVRLPAARTSLGAERRR
jgi:hypothetical protein